MRSSLLVSAVLLAGLLAAGAPTAARAQGVGLPQEYVAWSVEASPEAVPAGGSFRVTFDAAIEPGWKMYALDSPRPSRGVEIDFEDVPPGFSLRGAVTQAEPKTGFDPNFGIDVRYFEGEAAFAAAFAVDEGVEPGTYALGGTTTFMICNDRLCLPPTPVPFEVSVRVRAAAATPPAPPGGSGAEATAPDFTANGDALVPVPDTASADEAASDASSGAAVVPVESDLDRARAGGLASFLLLAIGAGLAALLTPCVFPMIPLTVSYFTKHAGDRGEAFRMASVYGLSIILTFTLLGVLMAVLLGAAGAQTIAANPWVNLFIGLVFVVFALSLLGLFELRLPGGVLNFFNRQSNERSGYLGVLFMGLTLTLVSFSCTAPFVGGLLAATAQDEWSYPILGMVVFSATFALPFLLFALFPKALGSLPRSGAWMNAVKVVLGFVELAAALKFISNADLIWGWGLLSRPVAIALATVIFFLAGLYLLGKLPLKNEPAPAEVGVVRLLFAIAFFGLSLYLLPGLFGAPLNKLDAYLPPRQGTDVSLLGALPRGEAGGTAEADLPWRHDIEAAYAEARDAGKPVFIDFTGYTCTNCREMEANVFPRPAVAERLRERFVLLRLYTDDLDDGPDLQRFQLRLTGTVALPTYAVVDPEGERLLVRTSGIASAEAFAAFLDEGAGAYAARSLALR